MSSKNKVIFMTYIAILLLFFAVVNAQDDFNAFSQKPVLTACEGSTITDIITVQNTGLVVSTYAISSQGKAAEWVAAAPRAFVLKPGETTEVYNYVTTPFGSRGDYNLDTTITTGFGTAKRLSQKLAVKNCLNLNLIPDVTNQNACQCNTATYKFTIKNTGTYTERYFLKLNTFSKYVTFSKNPVTVLPGRSEEVYLYLTLPCGSIGKKETTLKVSAERSGFSASTQLTLTTVSCYDFDIVAADKYDVCEMKTTIPLTIVNKDVSNSYNLKLSGPNWASINTNKIDIGPKQAKSIELRLDPGRDTAGSFSLTLEATALRGSVEKQKSFVVNKKDCYKQDVSIKRKIAVNYSETIVPAKIKNTGARQTTLLLTAKGPSWVSVLPPALTLNPGETKSISIKTAPAEEVKKGSYPVTINTLVKETNEHYSKEITVQLKESKTPPISTYLIISTLALVAVLIIILIMVFPRPKPTIKKPAEKPVVKKIIEKPAKLVKPAKPKKPKRNAVHPLIRRLKKIRIKKYLRFYLVGALIILAIITAIIAYSKPEYLSGIFNATKINVTQPTPVTPPVSEAPPVSWEELKDFFSAYLYYIIAGIALLIVFIVVIILVRKKARMPKKEPVIKEEEERPIVKRKEEKPAKIIRMEKPRVAVKRPKIKLGKWNWRIIAVLVLAGVGYLIYYYFWYLLNFFSGAYSKLSFLKPAFEMLLVYKYYTLAGAAILIALIIILRLTKREKKAEKAEEIKEKPKAEKPAKEEAGPEKTPAWSYIKWFIGLVLILAIIYCLFVFVLIPYWLYVLFLIAVLIFFSILIAILNKIKTKTVEEAIWDEVPLNTDFFMLPENKRLGFGELVIKTKRKLYNVKLTLKKLRRNPTFIRASERVYEYYKLEKENIKNADISKALMRFKVSKSWLDKNNVDKEQVTLKRYSNKWVGNKTTIIDSDRDYVYYESELDKLSYFAIAAKQREEKQKPKKWPLVVLLVLLIVAGIYYFSYMAQAPPEVEKNETEPVVKQTFATQMWKEDTTLVIDLSEHFYDPDNDKLVFTSTKPQNINVEISGSMAVLTPKPNWYGTSYIVFTADDGKGGIVSSEKVKLIVEEVPSQPFFIEIKNWFSSLGSSIRDFFAGYTIYVIYGVIALIALLLIAKYRVSIMDFFLEEEEKRPKKRNNKKGTKK